MFLRTYRLLTAAFPPSLVSLDWVFCQSAPLWADPHWQTSPSCPWLVYPAQLLPCKDFLRQLWCGVDSPEDSAALHQRLAKCPNSVLMFSPTCVSNGTRFRLPSQRQSALLSNSFKKSCNLLSFQHDWTVVRRFSEDIASLNKGK